MWVIESALSTWLQTQRLVIHTDLPESETMHYGSFFDGFYDFFADNYFELNQSEPLIMLLFANTEDYDQFCSRIGHHDSSFGFYMGLKKNTIVVNLEKGLGTAAHELTHHFLSLGGIDHHPDWINEGIPAFFEKFMGHIDEQGALHVSFGYFSNWRFPVTKLLIEDLTLADLFATEDQSIARSFTLYLHREGKLNLFVKALHRSGNRSNPEEVLKEILNQSLPAIENEWKHWVYHQPIDSEVELVPKSFIKTNTEWTTWLNENRDRLIWNDGQRMYTTR